MSSITLKNLVPGNYYVFQGEDCCMQVRFIGQFVARWADTYELKVGGCARVEIEGYDRAWNITEATPEQVRSSRDSINTSGAGPVLTTPSDAPPASTDAVR